MWAFVFLKEFKEIKTICDGKIIFRYEWFEAAFA
jgi:hypothetical protein